MAIDTRSGGIVARKRLAPFPDAADRNDGQYIAMIPAGDRVYVLMGGQGMEMSRLAVLDWPTLTVVTTNLLPQTSVVYRSVAVGPRTGRVYLFGNVQDSGAVVTVIDPASERVLTTWAARPVGSYNWRIYQGAVSTDEARLNISDHGPNTTGVDWFDLTPTGLQRCALPSRPNVGCLN